MIHIQNSSPPGEEGPRPWAIHSWSVKGRAVLPVHPLGQKAAPASPKVRELSQLLPVFLVLLHFPLAIVLQKVSVLVPLHALGTLALGLWWAVCQRNPERVAYVAAYLAGAEVLWRMTNKSSFLPWEFNKYALVLILVASMVRGRRFSIPMLPLGYFALLLPAAVITVLSTNSSIARNDLSFNLSGPLALTLSVAFFSRLEMPLLRWGRLMLSLAAPILSIVTLLVFHLAKTTVVFGRSSNYDASGGFGPNQVSSAMGLGILAAFLCALDRRARLPLKLFCLTLVVGFAAQSAITLSRSGLYLSGISLAGACFYLVQDKQLRVQVVTLGLALAVVIACVLPYVDAYTGGAVITRLQDTRSTGRDGIAKADLKIFMENPVFGIGVGRAKEERSRFFGHSIVAHTEYSRMLAEHGLFGIASLLFLLSMAVRHLLQARTARTKAAVVALVCYAFLFMAINGMRLMLPSLAFGLSAIIWVSGGSAPNPAEPFGKLSSSFGPRNPLPAET